MKVGSALFLAGTLFLANCGDTGPSMVEAQARGDDAPAAAEEVMQIDKRAENEIILRRTFAADRETVFAALTQAEHLVHWMQPSNMPLVICDVDPRDGGSFRYVFRRPSGIELEVRGSYEAFDPPTRFVYTETYDFSPLEVLVSTSLETVDAGTAFRQTLRYPSKEQRDEDFEGVATSSSEAYAKLERYLAQLAATDS